MPTEPITTYGESPRRRPGVVPATARALSVALAVALTATPVGACSPDSSKGDGDTSPAPARSQDARATPSPSASSSRVPGPPRDYPVRAGVSVPGSATLERARGRGMLIIGIRVSGAPLLTEKDPLRDKYSGFDIEVAMMVAADLGFTADQVRVMPATVLDVGPGSTPRWNASVDLHIGVPADQEARVATAGLLEVTEPYYIGGRGLLVHAGDRTMSGERPVTAGKRVCVTRVAADEARRLYPQANVTELDSYGVCGAALRAERFDAVYGDDPELRGWTADRPGEFRLVPVSPGSRPFGLAVAPGETALRDAVNAALRDHRANGDLTTAYRTTLGRSGLPEPSFPAR